MPEPADPSLAEATAAALAASPERTVLVEHGNQRYIAKRVAHRPRRLLQALFVRWLARRVTGQALPMRTLMLSDAASSVAYEARRLESLALAGVRVPRVVIEQADYLLLEHCGTTVATELETWTAATCSDELDRLAAELGAFHRAGQWHGAAQIKNLTRRGGLSFRIDFEEDFGERVPLAAAQALDLVLFLNSVSLAGPLDEAASRRLLPALLQAYFDANPDRALRDVLVRGLPWLTRLARWLRPLAGGSVKGRPRKGLLRLAILADALSARLGDG